MPKTEVTAVGNLIIDDEHPAITIAFQNDGHWFLLLELIDESEQHLIHRIELTFLKYKVDESKIKIRGYKINEKVVDPDRKVVFYPLKPAQLSNELKVEAQAKTFPLIFSHISRIKRIIAEYDSAHNNTKYNLLSHKEWKGCIGASLDNHGCHESKVHSQESVQHKLTNAATLVSTFHWHVSNALLDAEGKNCVTFAHEIMHAIDPKFDLENGFSKYTIAIPPSWQFEEKAQDNTTTSVPSCVIL